MSTYIQNRSKTKLRLGDMVKVITGDHKGEQGIITKFYHKKCSLIVEGVNMVTKHNKPSALNPKGSITSMEAPIHISNVMFLENDQVVRVGYRIVDDKKTRYSKNSQNEL